MKSINYKIREIEGDGNCLYRAIADQVYGTENYFDIVKSRCIDYIEIEKDFFCQFIEGGKDKFEDYIAMKRMNGVWGDDIEIQALSEIYNRPIELYSHSKEPLKTFHETSNSYTRGYERENNNDTKDNNSKFPIRLSYHGRSHYNSIIPMDNYQMFKNSLITSHPGEYENNILEKVKMKQIQEKIKMIGVNEDKNQGKETTQNVDNNQIYIDIYSSGSNVGSDKQDKVNLELSRGNFLEKRKINITFYRSQRFRFNFRTKINK